MNGQKIKKAIKFAKSAHLGQKRKSGDPYVTHPIAAGKILSEWKLDQTSIIAGILHDTVEDAGASLEEISNKFGDDVAVLVDGVTKVSHLRLRGSTEEAFVENLRKIILVMAKDLRVVLVKLADRLHNMRTLQYLPPAKQTKIAKETLEVFAPLAERLGMGSVKSELDELAFPYVYPKEYKKVKKLSKSHYQKAQSRIRSMKKELLKNLKKEGIKAEIHARKKSLYSLWRKLERPGIDWNFEKLNDIIAFRIIVNTVSECYSTLGVVHATYKPIPKYSISDFIAQPKPNGYQSIHPKVFGPGGRPVEIQIRTTQMHQQAEFGVAAHWAYTEAKTKGVSDKTLQKKGATAPKEKLAWVGELIKWQEEIKDSKEFLNAVKFDALNHRNFIFSPKGDVYDLPENATPIDFACAVHTKLIKYIKAATVNSKIVPLSYKLNSGDIVEIIKQKNVRNPNRDWLQFVATTTAKREIKKSLKK